MVQFIKQLGAYYANRYPGKCRTNAPFVLATGCGDPQTSGNGLVIANAPLAVSDPVKHPEFAGNVKTHRPECRPRRRRAEQRRRAPLGPQFHQCRVAESLHVPVRSGDRLLSLHPARAVAHRPELHCMDLDQPDRLDPGHRCGPGARRPGGGGRDGDGHPQPGAAWRPAALRAAARRAVSGKHWMNRPVNLPSLPRDSALSTSIQPPARNPKGILSFSPGLRGTSYPGLVVVGFPNPERVAARLLPAR